MQHFKSLKECMTYFRDEDTCWEYFEKMRWPNKPACPHCGNEKVYRLASHRQFKCGNKKNCNRKFTALKGTALESTKVPLSTWFAAIYLCTAHKKGISSYQLGKDLGVRQPTAWFMFHRIRLMMENGMGITLSNAVEIDELYVKGKRSTKSKYVRKQIAEGKIIEKESVVLGMIETGANVVYKVVASAEIESLKPEINKTVPDKESIIVTDGHNSYISIAKEYAAHEVVNHSQEEYVNDSGFTTNSIESAFSLLQRGIYGIYHHLSGDHLQRYCHEFAYRFNTRKMKDFERFNLTMEKKHLVGRLTYNTLIAKKSSNFGHGQNKENPQIQKEDSLQKD